MKRMIRESEEPILCMSNIRGKYVENPGKLPFSFYFSYSEGQHDIRVKPVFNPEKISGKTVGTLKLCDDWKFVPGSQDKFIKGHDYKLMIDFFKTYHVLFCAVWDGNLSDAVLEDWLLGKITWDEMLEEFDFWPEYEAKWNMFISEEARKFTPMIQNLEDFCIMYQLVNVRNK